MRIRKKSGKRYDPVEKIDTQSPTLLYNLSFPGGLTMVRAHVFFSGTVQGVGFRYTTQCMAVELQLTGWVKNLPDRRVEALIEGPKDSIDKLLLRLRGHFKSYLHDIQVNWSDAQGNFKKFTVSC